ncbi:hypothetical protein THAOC_37351, partial [Thalassiosira oceanica]
MAADRRSSAVRDVRESTRASLGQGNARVGGRSEERRGKRKIWDATGVRHGEQTEQSHESPWTSITESAGGLSSSSGWRMGGGKRLTTTKDVVVMAEEGRIAELESEIENEQLRRRAQGEGSHELLPVAVTVTVDLSQVDSGIVRNVTSFLGTSRELLNLALTCKSFGWRQPLSTLNLSLVEEVARQTVCSGATDDEMGCLPQYARGATTWLLILYRFEHLLMFDVLIGGYIEHRNGDKTAVCASGNDGTEGNYGFSVAVSSSYVMSSGAHYAEFLITGDPSIGIVRSMSGLEAGAYQEEFSFYYSTLFPDFLAQRSDDWGNSNVHTCDFCCYDGRMNWTDWDDYIIDNEWEGTESCQSGDTVGMLLNLDEGTLTVYKNNRRLGVMKNGLSGSYCWRSVEILNADEGTLTVYKNNPFAIAVNAFSVLKSTGGRAEEYAEVAARLHASGSLEVLDTFEVSQESSR